MRIVVIVSILTMVSSVAMGENWRPEGDKQLHSLAGSMISLSYPALNRIGVDKTPRIIATLALSAVIAATKEMTDPVFSLADLSYTVGATAICILGWDYLILPIDRGMQVTFAW